MVRHSDAGAPEENNGARVTVVLILHEAADRKSWSCARSIKRVFDNPKRRAQVLKLASVELQHIDWRNTVVAGAPKPVEVVQ